MIYWSHMNSAVCVTVITDADEWMMMEGGEKVKALSAVYCSTFISVSFFVTATENKVERCWFGFIWWDWVTPSWPTVIQVTLSFNINCASNLWSLWTNHWAGRKFPAAETLLSLEPKRKSWLFSMRSDALYQKKWSGLRKLVQKRDDFHYTIIVALRIHYWIFANRK